MAQTPIRILIAEDEAAVAKPLAAHLVAAGYHVAVATTIRELRDAVSRDQPDILVLDDTLDIDGLEYLQSIRFAPEHPRGGVVVMSESIAARERGLQLGAAAAVAKPLEPADLAATLASLLAYL